MQTKKRNGARRRWRVAPIMMILLLCIVIGWAWYVLRRAQTLPIHAVKTRGAFRYVHEDKLRARLLPVVRAGFFTVDMAEIRHRLLQMPWVAEASVSRVWPDTLIINFKEQAPLARWNHTHLIATSGMIFTPESGDLPQDLPQFIAPSEKGQQVLNAYQKMSSMLASVGLHITQLELNARRVWRMQLDNGMHITLGREYIFERLQRFVDVYHGVFGSKGTEAKRVDLRYQNGMAIRWRA